ncbi:sialin isoform X2 [Anabrus simplex]|uniref:sialin isoform X2 n=1 Tax=Anabrus simplex TaxID=316456 RepID=UPI0035A270EA
MVWYGIIPARYLFAVLAAISFAIIYGLKVNLSVAIVAMVNHTYLKGREGYSNKSSASECPEDESAHATLDDGPFQWSETVQGIILGSYFWGYLIGQLPGGRMSELHSAKYVMLIAVLMNIVGCVLTPVGSYEHYFIFIFLRVLQGFGGGLTFPAMHVLISHWAPPQERSVITTIIYAGTSLGTVISMIMAGQIAFSLGWEWVFYIMGLLSCIWCVLWVWLIKDFPQQQVYITQEERQYIVDSLGQTEDSHHKKPPVPWKAILTSVPFYAILIAHFCGNCGWYMLLTQLPTYMKQALKFNIKNNAYLSSLPYFCMWIFSLILSNVVDRLRAKKKISTGVARKICTGFASIVPAACFVAVGFVGCNKAAAVALMTVAISCIGGMFCGFLGNHIDIASNFAGTLMAITNSIATIPGITVPVLVGYLTEQDSSVQQWRKIFFGTAAIYVVLFIEYTIFASGEEQSWNKVESADRPETATEQQKEE